MDDGNQTQDGIAVAPVVNSAAAKTIPMVRPEDSAAEPVVGQAAPEDVAYWQSEGWVIQEQQ